MGAILSVATDALVAAFKVLDDVIKGIGFLMSVAGGAVTMATGVMGSLLSETVGVFVFYLSLVQSWAILGLSKLIDTAAFQNPTRT